MLSKDAFGASFAARLHTLAQLPGVEPHATSGVTRVLLCVYELDLLGALGMMSMPQALHKSQAKLVHTSPWPSGGIIGLDFIDFSVSRPFY